MGPFRCPVIPRQWLNSKSCTPEDGATINSTNLALVPPGKEFCCDTEGGGYFMASWYMVDADNSRFFCTDGRIYEVFGDGMNRAVILDEIHPRKFQFEQSVSGTGTITDDDVSGGIILNTGSTSGGTARLNVNGSCVVDLRKPAMMRFKLETSDSDNMLMRIGLGMTPVTTNSHANNHHIGLEIDSSDNTDLFYSLRTGSGLQTSAKITDAYPLISDNSLRCIIMWIPDVGVYFWANEILQCFKDYDLPNGETSASRWFSIGIKSRENTTKITQLKSLHIYAYNGDDY